MPLRTSLCLLAVFSSVTVCTAGASVQQPARGAENPLLAQIRAGLSAAEFTADALRAFNEKAGKSAFIPSQTIRDQIKIETAARHAAAIGALLRYDLDGDMRVSAAEISTVEKADPPRPPLAKAKKSKARPAPSEAERLMALCDSNRDGVIDIREIVQTDNAQARPRSNDMLVLLLDSALGKDGKLTRKEITALAQSTFKAVDINADGYVSPEEYAALTLMDKPAQLASASEKTVLR